MSGSGAGTVMEVILVEVGLIPQEHPLVRVGYYVVVAGSTALHTAVRTIGITIVQAIETIV